MTNNEAIKIIQAEIENGKSYDRWEPLAEALQMAVYALDMQEKYNAQYLDDLQNPLEPLKITSALNSEIIKFEYRKKHKPKDISVLDYTIISALKECLDRRTEARNE